MNIINGWFSNWSFWQFIIMIVGFCLLKFNDFKHTAKSLGEIKELDKSMRATH